MPPLALTHKIKQSELAAVASAAAVVSANGVTRQTLTVEGQTYEGYFKPCSARYPEALAAHEVAMSARYQLSLGKAAADVRLVYDEDGKVIGAFSFAIPRSKSLDPSKVSYKAEELVSYGVAPPLATSWYLGEGDLHPFNWFVELEEPAEGGAVTARSTGSVAADAADDMGDDWVVVETGVKRLGRWDFDESLWDEAVKIKGTRTIGEFTKRVLTSQDIDDFPVLSDANPCHWPTHEPRNGYTPKSYGALRAEFVKLKTDKEFKKQAYQQLLKEMLVNSSAEEAAIAARLHGHPQQAKEVAALKARKLQLWKALLGSTKFRQFLREEPMALGACLASAEAYNAGKPASQQINIDGMVVRYHCLCRNSLIMSLWHDHEQLLTALQEGGVVATVIAEGDDDEADSVEDLTKSLVLGASSARAPKKGLDEVLLVDLEEPADLSKLRSMQKICQTFSGKILTYLQNSSPDKASFLGFMNAFYRAIKNLSNYLVRLSAKKKAECEGLLISLRHRYGEFKEFGELMGFGEAQTLPSPTSYSMADLTRSTVFVSAMPRRASCSDVSPMDQLYQSLQLWLMKMSVSDFKGHLKAAHTYYASGLTSMVGMRSVRDLGCIMASIDEAVDADGSAWDAFQCVVSDGGWTLPSSWSGSVSLNTALTQFLVERCLVSFSCLSKVERSVSDFALSRQYDEVVLAAKHSDEVISLIRGHLAEAASTAALKK